MVALRKGKSYDDSDLVDITQPIAPTISKGLENITPIQSNSNNSVNNNEELEALLLKASAQMTQSFYDTDDIKIFIS